MLIHTGILTGVNPVQERENYDSAVPTNGITSHTNTCLASVGHFDELRATAMQSGAAHADLAVHWADFFSHCEAETAAELDQRVANLQRQIRDNGVTYNVYADAEGPQRPWALDLFPLLVDAAQWVHIDAGIRQRMQVLEAVMADVYGPQRLLTKGLLPPALVHGHPGYLRPLKDVPPVGGRYLHVAAFDLAHGADGQWRVVGQRCQAPSGLGYLLENRLTVSRQFPQAFEALRVQRLAGTYRALMESLRSACPQGKSAHIALLTPGPYNETYFEHAYLARYLGLTLVEGSDLVVRDAHLYLKTLRGLVPVHGLLKRVDDQYMDPLELRADSTLGIPGLLQAIRAGNVLVANAPGSAFLESPALLGFLPALARHTLQEDLLLPALPTWWCGEHNAMQVALQQLHACTIKPTYPGSAIHAGFDTAMGPALSASAQKNWHQRIAERPDEYTLQSYLPLSQMPTWQAGRMEPRSVLLRVFAVSDGLSPSSGKPQWRELPGGLARVAGTEADIASMQRGGSSADVWALTEGAVDTTTLLPKALTPAALSQRQRVVTSRAAENLFWLGRYTERAENSVRLALLTLEYLGGEEQSSHPLLQWLGAMAVANTLVGSNVPPPLENRRAFERALIDSLPSTDSSAGVGFNLRALKLSASTVRERLSQDHWNVIVRLERDLDTARTRQIEKDEFSPASALRMLRVASDHLAAITGAQTDRMTRDDGWRLLSIGRHVERLAFLSSSLARGFEAHALHSNGGFEAMLSLFDSTITYHAQYQQSREVAALTALLVLDHDNPRALAWVAHTLRGRLARLEGLQPGVLGLSSQTVPDPASWELQHLCENRTKNGMPDALLDLLFCDCEYC